MPPRLRLLVALVAGLMLAGCSSAPAPKPGDGTAAPASPGSTSPTTTLAAGTCWTGIRLGSDPQDTLALANSFHVPYRVTARAVADRPAFSRSVSCAADHAVEVFKLVRLPKLEPKLTSYAALLRVESPLYAGVDRAVEQACMTKGLARAAALAGLPGAVMAPVLPAGAAVGWAPATPDAWTAGQRVFACTLTWSHPQRAGYASVFTRSFGADKRTCIDSASLLFVDCARRHDRERIAVIEARDAVTAGSFPGHQAIRKGPDGRHLDVSDAAYGNLDAACTAYLRTISTTKRLTGVANIDVDQWPTPDGSYPIYCDADRRPDDDPLITTGSVYNR